MLRSLCVRIAASLSGLAFVVSAAHAAVGGGATIHNAATLSFSGGQVTASVQVVVDTLASAPVFTVDQNNIDVYAGDTANYVYTLTSTSNGSDTYSLVLGTTDTDVSAPGGTNITPAAVVLGASITSLESDASGNVSIPAGSETNLQTGDQVVINLGGVDHVYEIASLTPGTPASTAGNATTPETATRLTLTPVSAGAPVIGAGTVPIGTQLGERVSLAVAITAGTPSAAGTDGLHTIAINGTTSATDGTGAVVNFSDGLNATTTVLSGDGTLTKEVRNVTQGGAFATSGVTARSGDVLEYRMTAATLPGITLNTALIEDTVPAYTQYLPNSTQLNGVAVTDAGATAFPLDEGGLSINSPSGASGQIIDGETAVVLFQVTVD